MIEKLQAHYGFSRMPFGRDLAPGMLHRHASHNEAVARISWCISERSIGVVTGEVGAGKTVSVRTVLASLDPSRHTVIYLPNPLIGVRGIHEEIVGAFGQPAAHLGSRLTVQAGKALAAEREERGRTPVLVLDLCRHQNYADGRRCHLLGRLVRWAPAGLCCRHSYRLSRKARMASGGWYRPAGTATGVVVARARSLMVMSAWT